MLEYCCVARSHRTENNNSLEHCAEIAEEPWKLLHVVFKIKLQTLLFDGFSTPWTDIFKLESYIDVSQGYSFVILILKSPKGSILTKY